MKKLMTLLSTVALAGVMSVPMFAAKSTKPVKVSQTMAAQATSKGKAHTKHSKKHGTKAGKKTGQQNANPGTK